MKFCPQCRINLPGSAAFCKSCGGGLIEETSALPHTPISCPSCGLDVESNWRFCKQCAFDLLQPDITAHISSNHAAAHTCPRCGTQHRAEARFCKDCGETFSLTPSSLPATPFLAPSSVFPTAFGNGRVEFFRTKQGRVIATVAVALGLLICGWLLWGVKVTLIINPSDARIYIDEQEVSESQNDRGYIVRHLGRGQHTLRIQREGYDASTQILNLGSTDFSKAIEVNLAPSVFDLTVITSPTGCQVLLDGMEKGYTDRNNSRLLLRGIARGQHKITLLQDGYQDWTQTLDLETSQIIRAELKPNPKQTGGTESEIVSFLEGWAGSIRNKDLESHMNFYTDTLETYYKLSSISSQRVREDRFLAFSKYSVLDVQLSNFNIWVESDSRAVAIFDKNFDFRGEKNFSGAVQNRITLVKVNGWWRITGEEELQVYYVNK